MKKGWRAVLIAVLGICIISYFPAKKILSKSDFMPEWGKILSSRNKDAANEKSNSGINYRLAVKGISSENFISVEDVFEEGTDVLITNQEIEAAKSFYILQGQDEAEAEQSAIKYVEEYNAMYIEAVNNGYDVTEEEVDKYVSDFKVMAKQADNSDDIMKVIAQFESENEYWEYQKVVCQKQLPIQKYVKVLEEEYMAREGENEENADAADLWNKELDKIKERAAINQNYKKIANTGSIDKKFKI